TPENEIWDDPDVAVPPGAAPEPAAPAGQAPSGTSPTEKAPPPRAPSGPRRYTLQDTLTAGSSASPSRLVVLLAAVLGASLVLTGGLLVVRQLDGGGALTVPRLREAVLRQAEQNPGALAGIAVAVVVLGAGVLGGPLKAAARMAAVQAVRQQQLSMRTALAFPRAARGWYLGSLLPAAAGVELYVLAGLLVPLAWRGTCGWEEVLVLGGAAAACLGVGALGLGALAVEGPPREEPPPAVLGTYLANGSQTLASAALSLAAGLPRSALVLGFAWLTWFTTCEGLSWWGGEHVHWPRWGLDGGLAPEVEGGLYRLASW